MILVQLNTGSQRLFGSPEELAGAIRRGELGAESRIYHRATAQWLPITVHPEYRRAEAQQAEVPLPPLARRHWTFFSAESADRAQEQTNGTAAAATASVNGSKPEPGADGTVRTVSHSGPAWRRALRYIRTMGKG